MLGFVSVIIPVYNGSRYLREAIDSVLSQTYRNVEVVAVDDGSTDSSPEILASYGDRIRVIRQQNQGVGHARNAGLMAARGEFVGFLDQDDCWLLHKVERQLQEVEADPDRGFIHSEVTHFDDVRKVEVDRFNTCRSEMLVGHCYEQLLLGNGIFNSSAMVRRSVAMEAGMFDTEICGNTVQDYDLWLRCAKLTKFAYCPEKLSIYRLHPGQGMWNVKESHSELVQMLERHVGPPENVACPQMRQHFRTLFSQLAIEHLDDGERTAARQYLRRALRLGWSSKDAAIYAASFMPGALIDGLRKGRSRLRRLFRGEVKSRVPVWTGRVNNGV